jgi:hypothetical protein
MNRSSAPRKDPANGTWWFVVDLPRGEDGKRRQVKRRGFRTKAEAQQALDELRVAARQGTFVRPHRQPSGSTSRMSGCQRYSASLR